MARKRTGKIVSAKELADLLGVQRHTVVEWANKKGMPYTEAADRNAGKSWQFDTAAVFEWHREQAIQESLAYAGAAAEDDEISAEEADRRLKAAKAAIAQIDLAERAEEVVAVEDIAEIWAKHCGIVRTSIMDLPGRAAPVVQKLDDAAEIQKELRDIVNEILEELQDDRFAGQEAQGGSGEAG